MKILNGRKDFPEILTCCRFIEALFFFEELAQGSSRTKLKNYKEVVVLVYDLVSLGYLIEIRNVGVVDLS